MITDYHAKYFAYELTKRCASDSLEKLSSTLSNAQVDLNPHQIEAALFAFRSPLSKGAILADEVGLREIKGSRLHSSLSFLFWHLPVKSSISPYPLLEISKPC